MVYKIGLTSTHGTGKTSLRFDVAGALSKRGIKTIDVREVATLATHLGIPINQETTLEAQAWILHKQCSLELKGTIDKNQAIVSDRTVFDNYIYLANACGENPHYLNLALNHAKQHPYSKIYLLPIVGELEENGTRDAEDKQFQITINDKLETFLGEHNIEHIKLPIPKPYDKDREEWLKLIVYETLKDLKR
jgi:thymidylate kinase